MQYVVCIDPIVYGVAKPDQYFESDANFPALSPHKKHINMQRRDTLL